MGVVEEAEEGEWGEEGSHDQNQKRERERLVNAQEVVQILEKREAQEKW